MRQTKIKRLLALSGVANVGWFLLALPVVNGSYSASFNRLCYISIICSVYL
jgi:NADH:ubiquinone oxidoreductase subunit 2 (subunit N)